MTKTSYRFAAMTLLAGLSQAGCNMHGEKLAASLRASGSPNLFAAATSERKNSNSVDDVRLATHTEATPIRVLQANESLTEIAANAPGVVLVDFYADWCGPCKKQSEVLHDVEEYASSVNAQIIKVNVDLHRDIATAYQVTSLPTLVVLKEGQVDQTKTGLTDGRQVRKMLR